MSTILQQITDNTQREVSEREVKLPLPEVRQAAAVAPRPRPMALNGRVSVIAEVKRRSPSKGELATTVDPAARAEGYERGGAAAISVLTDEAFFGGSLEDLDAVRARVSLPVLCKDFTLTPYQVYEARAHGADLVLLVVAALEDEELRELKAVITELGMAALVEVHDEPELARAIAARASLIGINNRDLNDFSVNLQTTETLAPLVPDDVLVVSESGIESRKDVDRVTQAGAKAVLVGESLMRARDPAAAVRELLN